MGAVFRAGELEPSLKQRGKMHEVREVGWFLSGKGRGQISTAGLGQEGLLIFN